jgi:hypothetical protein
MRTGGTKSESKNPLRKRGWVPTRAGRWIDPRTKRSYTAIEAWRVISERGGGS